MTPEDFTTVFSVIHGVPRPFDWQTRLLHRVVEHGWPETIDAPTGAGKTAVLDIALFHLALVASNALPTPAPRRIVFAVDRRVIVDQAFNRACKIRRALENAADECVQAMAKALRGMAGGDAPLHVEMLRGGMPREDEWARSPVQPTILCTTVDQLGSRLLFRGYGVSRSMAPIHAGLLGEDVLLLLDEAHLSRPFQQTLNHVRQRRSPCAELARPWAICSLTATPHSGSQGVFRLSDTEKAEPAIATRLAATKRAELELCKDQTNSADHVAAFSTAAKEISRACTRSAPVVAIIVNRVALARSVLERLVVEGLDAILLTGRVRPVERALLLDKYEARLTSLGGVTESQAVPEPASGPLFVVATQCIEAGADFDFDAMVTQIASLDALRQRFGRLNRLGLREQAPAVIMAARNEIARGSDDPLYQGTQRETWEWLLARAEPTRGKERPAVGVSPNNFDMLVGADLAGVAKCTVSTKDAPVLRPADVAFLAMTNPRPHPDPHLPLFLHGEPASEADVAIVWRADCDIIAPRRGALQPGAEDIAKAIVACQPPVPGEALRVPIWAAKAWLTGASHEATVVTDAEGERDPHPENRYGGGRTALRWRGLDDENTGIIRADGLHAGDLIIVPASYGGCDRFGWSPTSTEPVKDIACTAAAPYHGRYFALRLHPALWPSEAYMAWDEAWPQLQRFAVEDDAAGLIEAVQPLLPDLPDTLAKRHARIELPYDAGDDEPSGAILIAPHGIAAGGVQGRARLIASTEDELAGCFADGSTSLECHTGDVVRQVEDFTNALGLHGRLAATIAFAARYHDVGKADLRFQEWLSGPGPSPAILAKSGHWRGARAEQLARTAAGVPAQWRHEVLSVRIASQHLDQADVIDPALALYLIGTHHGHGRPFFPHHDPWDAHAREVFHTPIVAGPGPERLDFDWRGRDWAELIVALQADYGVWGLAFLEAVLRLADHRASEHLP